MLAISNQLFGKFSAADAALLEPCLLATDLPRRKILEERGRDIEYVYFIANGVASVVASGINDRAIEVGVIGREGMSGVAVILGESRWPYETYMQVPGHGWKMSAGDLRRVIQESGTLKATLMLYSLTVMVQLGFTILANGKYKVDERLARWLLMALDRVDGDTVALTHDFLAMMLGVRRAGVTVALQALEDNGAIRSKRGAITILDRDALKDLSGGSYGAAEAEYARIFSSAETGIEKPRLNELQGRHLAQPRS